MKKQGKKVTRNCEHWAVNECDVQIGFIELANLHLLDLLTDSRAMRPISLGNDGINEYTIKENQLSHYLMKNVVKFQRLTTKSWHLQRRKFYVRFFKNLIQLYRES
ncbi:hypothetical protein ACOME3_003400 [Neoechinorhynchus agilis]